MKKTLLAMGLSIAMLAAPAIAHVGHDHGDAPQPAGRASPRIEAHSEDFELVGALNGTKLRMWLDRFATNEPVVKAKLAVESESYKADAAEIEPGVYEVDLGALAKPGKVQLVFAVSAQPADDLLEGELVIEAEPTLLAPRRSMAPWAILGIAAAASFVVVALAAFLMRIGRRKGAKR